MKQGRTIRNEPTHWGAVCCALLAGVLLCASALGQVSSYGDKETGQNTGDQLPQVLKGVAVSQHLNQQLPLDANFFWMKPVPRFI